MTNDDEALSAALHAIPVKPAVWTEYFSLSDPGEQLGPRMPPDTSAILQNGYQSLNLLGSAINYNETPDWAFLVLILGMERHRVREKVARRRAIKGIRTNV